ncbi:EB1 protein [Ancylostoma ceylanicum]|uniref:EB1 protein n=1 Tax=Ancylostoma ceylanicum TaxID=53326 RepID=A0A0D6L914_9BILA|nr:EB1 protein [Ancylostoma ceylanicum]
MRDPVKHKEKEGKPKSSCKTESGKFRLPYDDTPLPAGAKGPAPARAAPLRNSTTTTVRTAAPPMTKRTPPNPVPSSRTSAVDSSALKELEQENAKLTQQNEEMTNICETLESERNFYFEKLRRIEDMCNSCADGENPDKEAILAILYEANDGTVSKKSRCRHAQKPRVT